MIWCSGSYSSECFLACLGRISCLSSYQRRHDHAAGVGGEGVGAQEEQGGEEHGQEEVFSHHPLPVRMHVRSAVDQYNGQPQDIARTSRCAALMSKTASVTVVPLLASICAWMRACQIGV